MHAIAYARASTAERAGVCMCARGGVTKHLLLSLDGERLIRRQRRRLHSRHCAVKVLGLVSRNWTAAYALVLLFVFLADPFDPRERILHIAKDGVGLFQISVDIVHRGLCTLYLLCMPQSESRDSFASVQTISEHRCVPPWRESSSTVWIWVDLAASAFARMRFVASLLVALDCDIGPARAREQLDVGAKSGRNRGCNGTHRSPSLPHTHTHDSQLRPASPSPKRGDCLDRLERGKWCVACVITQDAGLLRAGAGLPCLLRRKRPHASCHLT